MGKCKSKCKLKKFLSILMSFCLVVASMPAELMGRSCLAPPGGRKFLQSVFTLSGADTVDPPVDINKNGLHITKQDGIISTQDLYRRTSIQKISRLKQRLKMPYIQQGSPGNKRRHILTAVQNTRWIYKTDIELLLADDDFDDDTKKYLKEAADMIEKRKPPAFDFITMDGRKALFIFIALLHTNRHLSEAVTLLHLTEGNISVWSRRNTVRNLLEKYHQHHIELNDIQEEESNIIKMKVYAYRQARALADGDINGMADLLNIRAQELKKDLKGEYAYILQEEIDMYLQERIEKEIEILNKSKEKMTAFDIAEKLKEDKLSWNFTLDALSRMVWHDALGFKEILCHPNFIIAEFKERPKDFAQKEDVRKRILTLTQRRMEAIGKAFLWAHWGTEKWNPGEAAEVLGLPAEKITNAEWQKKTGIKQYLAGMQSPPIIDKKEIPGLNLKKVEEQAYRESWRIFPTIKAVASVLDVTQEEAREKLIHYGLAADEGFLTIEQRRINALKNVLAYTNGVYQKAGEILNRRGELLRVWRKAHLPASFDPETMEVQLSEEDLKNRVYDFDVIERKTYAEAWKRFGDDLKKISEAVGEHLSTVRIKVRVFGLISGESDFEERRYDIFIMVKDLDDNSITISELMKKLEQKGYRDINYSKIVADFRSAMLKPYRRKLKTLKIPTARVTEKGTGVSRGGKIKYDISTEMPGLKGKKDEIGIMLHELELIKNIFLKEIYGDLNELKKFAKKDMGIDIEPLKKLIIEKKDKKKKEPSIVSIIPLQYLQTSSALNYVLDPKDNTLNVFTTVNLGKNELAKVKKTTRTLKRLQKVKFEPRFLIECVACWAVGRLLCNVLMKDVTMMEEKVLEISKKLLYVDPIIDIKIKGIKNYILILHMQFEEKAYEIVKCFPQLNIQVLEKLGNRISLDTFYFDTFSDLQELKRYIMVLFGKELEERQPGDTRIIISKIVSKINYMIENFESGDGDSEEIYAAIEGLRRTGEGGLADSLKGKLDLLCGVTEISAARHGEFYMGTTPEKKRKQEELIELQVVMSLPFLTKKEKGDDEKTRAIVLKGCEKIRKKEKGRERFGIADLLLTAAYNEKWKLVQAFLINLYKDKSLMRNTAISSAAKLSLEKIREAAKKSVKTKKKKLKSKKARLNRNTNRDLKNSL